MSPQAAAVKKVSDLLSTLAAQAVFNSQPNVFLYAPLGEDTFTLTVEEAQAFIEAANTLIDADQKAEPAVNAALYPAARPISDFLGIYAAKLEASGGGRQLDDGDTAFDYRVRGDRDPRLLMTVGQIRAFIAGSVNCDKIFVVMGFKAGFGQGTVASFVREEEAVALCAACTEYERARPIGPGSPDRASRARFNNDMDYWRANHPGGRDASYFRLFEFESVEVK